MSRDEHDSVFRNDAPPILSYLAVFVAIVVLVAVVPGQTGRARRTLSIALSPVLGAVMVAFPRIVALAWFAWDYEPPPGVIRIVGWVLIVWPLLVLL